VTYYTPEAAAARQHAQERKKRQRRKRRVDNVVDSVAELAVAAVAAGLLMWFLGAAHHVEARIPAFGFWGCAFLTLAYLSLNGAARTTARIRERRSS
jgi:hypothetical protein